MWALPLRGIPRRWCQRGPAYGHVARTCNAGQRRPRSSFICQSTFGPVSRPLVYPHSSFSLSFLFFNFLGPPIQLANVATEHLGRVQWRGRYRPATSALTLTLTSPLRRCLTGCPPRGMPKVVGFGLGNAEIRNSKVQSLDRFGPLDA
jgi:hypothetical protein